MTQVNRAQLATTLKNIFDGSGRTSDAVSREEMQCILKLGDTTWTQEELDTLFGALGGSQRNNDGRPNTAPASSINFKQFVDFVCMQEGVAQSAKQSEDLSSWFLGDYLKGGIYDGDKYRKMWDRTTSSHVLKHEATGVQVWRDAIDLRSFGSGPTQVLYHYTSERLFSKIVSKGRVLTELYEEILEDRDYFGTGLFCTKMEPARFSNIMQILVNMFAAPEVGPFSVNEQMPGISYLVRAKSQTVVRCVPILVPPDIMFSFHTVEAFKDSLESLHQDRDLWGLEIANANEDANAMSLEEANDMLLQTRTKRVSMLRKTGERLSVFEEMEGLANLLNNIEQPDIAEPLLRETLAHRQSNMGPQHPDTLATMASLAASLTVQNILDEAEQLYREVLEGRRVTLGPSNEETIQSAHELAEVLELLGKGEEAARTKRSSWLAES